MSTKTLNLPSQERLKRDFTYNPETGDLTRCDGLIENLAKNGYWRISVWGEWYLSHRLIWKYMTGEDPTQIDHINGDKQDNRISNLRNVSPSENQRNRRKAKNNTSGYNGVRLDRTKTNWHAFFIVNGKHTHVGTFRCPTAAFIGRQLFLKEFYPNLFTERHGT